MDKLKLGIIGTGSVVREIYQYLYFRSRYADIISVEAACDVNDRNLEWFAGTWDVKSVYSDYREKGLEILDFPCNQFGKQAPGSDQEITDFCVGRFAVDFKIFSKIDVNGSSEEPLFRYLKREKPGLMGGAIKWNFTKFLVDREGRVIKRYAPMVTPEKIESDIVSLLS